MNHHSRLGRLEQWLRVRPRAELPVEEQVRRRALSGILQILERQVPETIDARGRRAVIAAAASRLAVDHPDAQILRDLLDAVGESSGEADPEGVDRMAALLERHALQNPIEQETEI